MDSRPETCLKSIVHFLNGVGAQELEQGGELLGAGPGLRGALQPSDLVLDLEVPELVLEGQLPEQEKAALGEIHADQSVAVTHEGFFKAQADFDERLLGRGEIRRAAGLSHQLEVHLDLGLGPGRPHGDTQAGRFGHVPEAEDDHVAGGGVGFG